MHKRNNVILMLQVRKVNQRSTCEEIPYGHYLVGLGISELSLQIWNKMGGSMAKFGVEHESVKIFDLR